MIVPPDLLDRLRSVRLVVCDVDGTLTDGAMYYGPDGEIMKRFYARDGHGISMMRDAGIIVAFVTREDSAIAAARAKKLGIEHLVLGCLDKDEAVATLQATCGIAVDATLFIGDDLPDLGGFARSGIAVAVADAVDAVREAADLLCSQPGGRGAVREVADAILAARG